MDNTIDVVKLKELIYTLRKQVTSITLKREIYERFVLHFEEARIAIQGAMYTPISHIPSVCEFMGVKIKCQT